MSSKLKTFAREKLPHAIPVAKAVITAFKHLGSRKKVRCLLKERQDIFINVGAGNVSGQDGWITLDVSKNCDLYWDLRKGLPFPDGSVKKIYSSHFFEHLSFQETRGFLAECQRAMSPGAKFLICVPNAKIYLEAYVMGKELDTSPWYQPAYNHTTRIDYVNYTAYMDGMHKYMFDEENLLHILRTNGFKNVRLRQFDPSLDMKQRDFESLYAEGEK